MTSRTIKVTNNVPQEKDENGRDDLFYAMTQYNEKIGILAAEAYRIASSDPAISVIKFRVFGELLAGEVGRIKKKLRRGGETADVYLKRLQESRYIPEKAANSFHEIRKIGNSAAHGDEVTEGDALEVKTHATELIEWFLGRYARDQVTAEGPLRAPASSAPKSASALRKPSKAEVLARKLRSSF